MFATTNVSPAQGYAHTAVGMAPSSIDACKRNIAEATGLMGPGACATTVIAWSFQKGCYANKSADPRIALPLEQVKSWMEIWKRSSLRERRRIGNKWSKLLRKIAHAKSRWQMVRSPASATIATLLDLGWKPIRPNQWLVPDGSHLATFDAVDGVTQHHVLHILETALHRRLWDNAANAYSGSGLEGGLPSLLPASKAHKALTRQGRYQEAKALECIVINKSWCGQRLQLDGGADDARAMCERCGSYVESPFHRYYTCEKNRDIDHKDVRDTQHLCHSAASDIATKRNGTGQFCRVA